MKGERTVYAGRDSNHDVASPDDAAQLQKLREAWGVTAESPLLVVGRLTGYLREDMPDVFFLSDLSHPDSGHGLVYPLAEKPESTSAFVPPAEVRRWLSPKEAVSGSHWAIAELELASAEVRRQHNNPQKCDVRRGTLRLLSACPPEWRIEVRGTQSALQIADFARTTIEDRLQKDIGRVAAELSAQEDHKRLALKRIEDDLQSAATEAEKRRAKIATQIDEDKRHRTAVRAEIKALQARMAQEETQLEGFRRMAELERITMEERYRQLQHLLSEKGRRLVALGLIDVEDLTAVLPPDLPEAERGGLGLDAAFGGDFARLAPWLQVRLSRSGLLYSQAQLRNFVALLRTRDLVVLAGDSGSGKTSLVRAVAEAVGGVCTVIPVKPNWTGPEDLLGYYNPIERSYHPTPFLLALQAAARAPGVPHFICLDEMNLARVEHYFADFLSLLESRATSPEIDLYTADEERHLVMEHGVFLELEAEARRRAGLGDDVTLEELLKNDQANDALSQLGGFRDADSVLVHHARLRRALAAQMRMPTSLRFPDNVWILGAVNMDETTHHLSPKVLDRVHVLRFGNPMLADWEAIEAEIATGTEEPGLTLTLAPHEIGRRSDYPAFDRRDDAAAFLAGIARDYLDPLGIEFGLRAVRQSRGYLAAAESAGIAPDQALDNVVRQKILPKIALDTSRPTAGGRKRRDVLLALREALADRLGSPEAGSDGESSVKVLDRLIALSDGNNRVVNYWMR